jgi:hypothetical protein
VKILYLKRKFQFLLFDSNCLENQIKKPFFINWRKCLNFTPFKFSGWLKDLLAFIHYFTFRNLKEEIRNYHNVLNLAKKSLLVVVIVLKPGPARRVDPGPGWPGHGTGPGLSKNPPGSWPGKTRSTQRVDPGPGRLGQTRLRPGLFFFYMHRG